MEHVDYSEEKQTFKNIQLKRNDRSITQFIPAFCKYVSRQCDPDQKEQHGNGADANPLIIVNKLETIQDFENQCPVCDAELEKLEFIDCGKSFSPIKNLYFNLKNIVLFDNGNIFLPSMGIQHQTFLNTTYKIMELKNSKENEKVYSNTKFEQFDAICLFTNRRIFNPIRTHLCNHIEAFDLQSIVSYILESDEENQEEEQEIKCPYPDCKGVIQQSTLFDDVYLDQKLHENLLEYSLLNVIFQRKNQKFIPRQAVPLTKMVYNIQNEFKQLFEQSQGNYPDKLEIWDDQTQIEQIGTVQVPVLDNRIDGLYIHVPCMLQIIDSGQQYSDLSKQYDLSYLHFISYWKNIWNYRFNKAQNLQFFSATDLNQNFVDQKCQLVYEEDDIMESYRSFYQDQTLIDCISGNQINEEQKNQRLYKSISCLSPVCTFLYQSYLEKEGQDFSCLICQKKIYKYSRIQDGQLLFDYNNEMEWAIRNQNRKTQNTVKIEQKLQKLLK